MLTCVFWNSTQRIKHQVCCVWANGDRVYTGSSTGEICFWNGNWPGVLTGCCGGRACMFLGTVKSPNELFLTCKGVLVSVHQDFKIRTWDWDDGRCLNSEKLVDFGKLVGLECSGDRLVGVVYENSFVVYDSWVLQKLQIIRSESKILKVRFLETGKILLLNEGGELIFWHYLGVIVDPEPYFELKLGLGYKDFEVNSKYNLIALLGNGKVEIGKIEDLKLKTLNFFEIGQSGIRDFQFCEDYFILATSQKAFIYQLIKVQEKISSNSKENSIDYHELYIDFKDFKLINSKLISIHSRGLSFIDLIQDSFKTNDLIFEIPGNTFTFLDKDENLTYSHIIPQTWQLFLGTSKGKVITSTLTSAKSTILHTFENSSVSSIYLVKQYILSSSSSGELFIYHPSKPSALCTLLSPGKDFFPIALIQDSSEINQFWKSSWKNWEESVLVHCEDNSISIVSFVTNSITCNFLSNIKHISEVAIHIKLEYLFVKSNETVLIFNIFTQNFERILTGFAANDIMRKVVNVSQMDFHSSDDLPCDEHRVVEVNWRSMGKNGKSLSFVQVQECLNPIINLFDVVEDEMIGKIVALLTCWDCGCSAHDTIVTTIDGVVRVLYQFYFGLVGDGWFSFYLPHKQQYSKLIDSLRAATLFKLTKLACSNLRLGLGILSYKSLTSPKSCQAIIRDFITTLSPNSKEKIIASCKQILHLRTPSSKVVQKSLSILGKLKTVILDSEWNRSRASLAETQAALILPYFYIDLNKEIMLTAATSIFAMLRIGGDKLNCAGKVLVHTLTGWKAMVMPQFRVLIKEMIGLAAGNQVAEGYFKVVGTLALSDLKGYMGLLSEEIEKVDNLTRKAWLTSLNWMASHKYTQLAYYAQNIVDAILKILSPHNVAIRKLCLEQCCEILHILVKKLPMVDFSQAKQKIAVGTSECTIIIYDLKTASFWKCLEGHTGPLSAVMFSNTGNSLVSYSSHDLTARLWKIEVRFYQELFTSKSITASSIFSMNKVKSGVNYYKEFVEGVKFQIKNSQLSLIREDLKEYEINITLA